MEIILRDFLMFYQIFLSPQVKRRAIISIRAASQVSAQFKTQILGNKEKIRKISKFARMIK